MQPQSPTLAWSSSGATQPNNSTEAVIWGHAEQFAQASIKDFRIDDIFTDLHILERAVDGSKKPSNLKLQFLRFITKSFSDELKIGDGGCGQVYKGILPNGIIAVKKLLNSHTIDEKMFPSGGYEHDDGYAQKHSPTFRLLFSYRRKSNRNVRENYYGRDAGKIALFGVCKQWKS